MEYLLKYWLLCIARAIVSFFDMIFDALLGVTVMEGSKMERNLSGRSYKHSAQVVSVLWRAKHHILKLTRLHNFLYKHEKYVNPDTVLENENITLMAVERNYALFAMSDLGVDIYDTRRFPFLYPNQYIKASKLVILPIKSFHRLAEKVGDPKLPVVFMATTFRTGSTLLAQMFNRIPGTRVMSESSATSNIHELRVTGQISVEESLSLLRSAVRLQCKVETNSKVQRIYFKAHPDHSMQLGDISRMFPHFKLAFSTRYPLGSLKSIARCVVLGFLFNTYYYRLGIYWRELAATNFALSYNPRYRNQLASRYSRWMPSERLEVHRIMLYSASLLAFLENRPAFNGRIILYDDLVKYPKAELERLCQTLEVPLDNVPLMLETMAWDSKQNRTFEPKKYDEQEVDPESGKIFDSYMEMLDLPIRHNVSLDEFKSFLGCSI